MKFRFQPFRNEQKNFKRVKEQREWRYLRERSRRRIGRYTVEETHEIRLNSGGPHWNFDLDFGATDREGR